MVSIFLSLIYLEKSMKLSTLNSKLQAIDDNFSMVNWGGCACVAHMLAEQLRRVFPVMRITSGGWGERGLDIDAIRPNGLDRANCDDNGFTFNHVWVEIWYKGRWYAIDSDGVRTRTDMHTQYGVPAKGSFSIDEMRELASTQWGWNRSFDRAQLPAMQKFITETIH